MPATDFRIAVGFFEHPKTMKLQRRLGDSAVLALLRLIRFCATTLGRSDGRFDGMDVDDIEIAAGWSGDPGELVDTLCALRWIDTDPDEILTLHDFEDHNPWVAGADRRSRAAKKAAQKRWGRYSGEKPKQNATRIENDAARIENDANRNATAYDPQCEPHRNQCAPHENRCEPQCPSPTVSESFPSESSPSGPHGIAPVRLNPDVDDSEKKPPWKTGDPIASTADLEAFAAEQEWGVTGLSSKDRGRAHAMIRAGPISPEEIREGIDRMGAVAPARPVGYWLSCIDAARAEFKAEAERDVAGPKPSKTAITDDDRRWAEENLKDAKW